MWQPKSADELANLVTAQLAECDPQEAETFGARRVPLGQVSIQRGDAVESVFVVAEHEGEVIYYDDVEEGFNVSALDERGFIAQPGYEQHELRHALRRWLEPNPTFQRTAKRPLN